MKQIIPFRRSFYLHVILYGIFALLCILASITLFGTEGTAEKLIGVFALMFSLYPFWFFCNVLVRKICKVDCFCVTADGLKWISHPFLLGFLRFPIPIRLIPWSCMESFRVERTNGMRLMIVLTDRANFPKGYSSTVSRLIGREQNKGIFGFEVDLHLCAEDPEALLQRLEKHLREFGLLSSF